MPTSYVRKTDNPNMGWSEERKAAWSERVRKAHADGTWNKMSKKKIGQNISKGRKAANKKRSLSNARKRGWETRRSNGNGGKSTEIKAILNHPPTTLSTEYCPTPQYSSLQQTQEMIFAETTDVLQVQKILDLLKEHFGITCSIEDFVNSAIREKIERVNSVFAKL